MSEENTLDPEVVEALTKSSIEGIQEAVQQMENESGLEVKSTSEQLTDYAQEMGKAAENPEELKIENQAPDQQIEFVAKFFHMYLPIFKQKFKKLSSKAKDRVMERLLEHPLGDKKYNWPFKEEKDLFLIGDRLLESKYAMFRYVINDELQKAESNKIDMSQVTRAEVPGTGKTMDELRKEEGSGET